MRCKGYCNEPISRGGRFIGLADKGPPKDSINRGDIFPARRDTSAIFSAMMGTENEEIDPVDIAWLGAAFF
jgi:hypothetical protein